MKIASAVVEPVDNLCRLRQVALQAYLTSKCSEGCTIKLFYFAAPQEQKSTISSREMNVPKFQTIGRVSESVTLMALDKASSPRSSYYIMASLSMPRMHQSHPYLNPKVFYVCLYCIMQVYIL